MLAALTELHPSGTLGQRFMTVREATESLCVPLSDEDCTVQSMPEASPVKWHLAHTTWFFETFLLQQIDSDHPAYDSRYRELFNSYYQSVGPRHERAARGVLSRPSLAEIKHYRNHVDRRLLARLRGPTLSLEAQGILELGLQHEQQHQELILTDMLHALSRNPLRPAYRRPVIAERLTELPQRARSSQFETLAAGLYSVGDAGAGFAFDNERPAHQVWLGEFQIARRPLSNREFREFVRAGGYRAPLLWMADGWALIERERWQHPLYWNEGLDSEFTLDGEQALDPDAPVSHLSYYEADACARWSGARLPTEFEWEVAARAHSSQPLHELGDVWEWTASAYAPYPRFQTSSGALGEYNGKFMANQFVLRGGSRFTPVGHARLSYRNFFYPQARWQRAGLRVARDG